MKNCGEHLQWTCHINFRRVDWWVKIFWSVKPWTYNIFYSHHHLRLYKNFNWLPILQNKKMSKIPLINIMAKNTKLFLNILMCDTKRIWQKYPHPNDMALCYWLIDKKTKIQNRIACGPQRLKWSTQFAFVCIYIYIYIYMIEM